MGSNIRHAGRVDSLTLLNDSGTALTASDIGSPVVIKAANTDMATLAAANAPEFFILESVGQSAEYVTVGRNKCYDNVPYSGAAPDPTSATPWVKADGSGGVAASATMTCARVLSVDTAAGTCSILVK